MAVSEFKSSADSADTNEGSKFEHFIAVVDEYIKDSSPSEVNIDSVTKSHILTYTERDAYMQLDLVSTATRI